MDVEKLAKALRDTVQSTSNAISSNVSFPVDAIAWALRKAGLDIPENAMGGSEWMAQKGLTVPVEEGIPKMAGEVLGGIGPAVVAAKAPQVASGLMKMGENAMAPSTLNKQTGGVLNPFPNQNYHVDDLSKYTPNIFRETDIEGASKFGINDSSQPIDLYFANQPEYAIGQGSNKGVLMELDAKSIPGQLSLTKPSARNMYDSGYAEFISRSVDPAKFAENVKSVTINKDQQKGPYFRRVSNELRSRGFTKSAMEDGSIKFSK